MILSTDRDGAYSATLEAGDVLRSLTVHASRPLWQVKWWRRVTVSLVLLGLVALLGIAYWLEESRSGLLIRLTEENRYQRTLIQCYKQAPLSQGSWLARETVVKACVERANP